jgi:hypothetical protein
MWTIDDKTEMHVAWPWAIGSERETYFLYKKFDEMCRIRREAGRP